MLTEHSPESAGVRLLGGFDQYVLRPGTDDDTILPKEHRAAVSPTTGYGRLPQKELQREAAQLARAKGKPLTLR